VAREFDTSPMVVKAASDYARDYVLAVFAGDLKIHNVRVSSVDDVMYVKRKLRGVPGNVYCKTLRVNWDGMFPGVGVRDCFDPGVAGRLRSAMKDCPWKFVTGKDVTFELDAIGDLGNVVAPAEKIVRVLSSLGARGVHIIFSGWNGVHVVAPDGFALFENYIGSEGSGWFRTPASTAYAAGVIWETVLDMAELGDWRKDPRAKGRIYGESFCVHMSPNYNQGLRKAPWFATKHGTISAPMDLTELNKFTRERKNFNPGRVIRWCRVTRGVPVVS